MHCAEGETVTATL